MKDDLINKIQNILGQDSLSEDLTRSLMVLLRKLMESMSEQQKADYATLNLFCNWVAHVAITQSVTGLRTLRRINDALVRVRGSADKNRVQLEMSEAIGFGIFRAELFRFLDTKGTRHRLAEKQCWEEFLSNILELIRDVPLLFPPMAKLKRQALKIYTDISNNPVKPGTGVVEMRISRIDYSFWDKNLGEVLCLILVTENKISIVIPLLMQA